MKTPSVIKKALASVLSAAMIVAFAPTAAFADIQDNVQLTVTYDANDGVASSALVNETSTSGSELVRTLVNAVENGNKCSKGYAAFDFWFYDANNNDVYDDGDVKVIRDNFENTLNVKDIPQVEGGTTDITLKASYKEISATASTSFSTAVDNYDEQNGLTDVNVTANGLKIGTYMACIDTHGGPVYSDEVTVSAGSQATFCVHVHNYFFKAGDIDVYVVDNSFNKVTGTECKFHICTVTCKAGDYGAYSGDGDTTTKTKTYLVAEGTQANTLKLAKPTVDSSSNYQLESTVYLQEDGSGLPNTVTRDLTLVAQYNNPKVSKLTFDGSSNKLSYGIANLPVYENSSNKNLERYKVTVLSGSTEVSSYEVDNSLSSVDGTLTFGSSADNAGTTGTTKTKAAAGTYIVKVEAQYKADTDGNTPVSVSKSVTVCAIELDANGGKAPNYKAAPTLIQAGKTLSSVVFDVTNPYSYQPPDSTMSFDGWSVDGTTKADNREVVAPADGSSIKLKALWKVTNVAKPTLTSAVKGNNDTYTLIFGCATEGVTLIYALDGTDKGAVPADGITDVAASSYVTVTANAPADSSLNPQSETFYGYSCDAYNTNASPLDVFDTFASNLPGVQTAKETGDAAITAQGFATPEQWEEVLKKQAKAIVEAVVSNAKTQIESLRTLAKSEDDKTYSKLSDSDYKAAIKKLNAIVEGFNGSFDENAVTKIVNDAKTAAAANTFDAADVDAATAVTDALKAAKSESAAKTAIEAYKKLTDIQKSLVDIDDVIAAYKVIVNAEEASAGQASSEAAAALKEAEQAKKDAEQAKVAAEQAKAAAEQAAKDAAQAKDEAAAAEQAKQEADIDYNDLLAASKLTKMKVVAKAKKGKKARGEAFSYNLAASASGAKATYAKVYGSKYISVSANGKVTFAKVKAGKKTKKFKARVSVTFGTQTVKKNLWYVVKALPA